MAKSEFMVLFSRVGELPHSHSARMERMPSYRDEVIVLRTHKLGEADRIITALGKTHGKIRAVAKGVRKTGSRIGSRLEPFAVADVQFYEGRNLDTVQQVESIALLGSDLAADYDLYTTGTAMVETADRLTDHDHSTAQYQLLLGGLKALASKAHVAELVLDSYILRALSIAGWTPELTTCVLTGVEGSHTHFLVTAGGVVADTAAPPGTPRLKPESLALLAALLAGNWSVADASDPVARREVRGIVAAYLQFHLERSIRSLSHIDSRKT
jgi:DNA repair protein RecO (recombination protein O)